MANDPFDNRPADGPGDASGNAPYDANQANHATPHARQDSSHPHRATPVDAAAVRDLGDDLDADLIEMRQRALADGALWRASLPPLDTLRAQVSALSAQRRAQASAHVPATTPAPPSLNNRREDRSMADDTSNPISASTAIRSTSGNQPPRRRAPLGGLRSALAAVAAVIVVALLAGVLVALRNGHGNTGGKVAKHATPTVTTTTEPTVNPTSAWHAIPGLKGLSSAPVIAPGDPRVVYHVGGTAANAGNLQRSDDQGATWQDLPVPGVFPSQDSVTWEDIFVSPLNANTVYAMASLSNNSGAVNCPTPYSNMQATGHPLAGAVSTTQRGFASALSGVVPCETQVISVDGGQHWRILTLPFGGRLGNASASLSGLQNGFAYSLPPEAQGSRLYSYADNGYLASSSGNRLATSTDGGTSWQAIDGGLTSQGLTVCWYVATPIGSTVYAVAATSCDPFAEPPQSLWRSNDAGATWRKVNMPPGVFTANLTLANTPTPTLYLMAPTINVQPHTFNLSVTPSNIYSSADGGQTWQALPTRGIYGNPANQIDFNLAFVAAPDGTLVAPFVDNSANASSVTPTPGFPTQPSTRYYSWQPGDTAWKPLSSPGGSPFRLFLVSVSSSGVATIGLLNDDVPIASQAAYSVYTLMLSK